MISYLSIKRKFYLELIIDKKTDIYYNVLNDRGALYQEYPGLYALPKQNRAKGVGAEDGMWQNIDLAE